MYQKTRFGLCYLLKDSGPHSNIPSFLTQALFSLFVAGSPLGLNSTNTSLRWTGKVPGHGIMTFYGSIDNVRDQMFALNPSLRHNRVLNSPYNPYTGKNPRPLDETEMAVNKFAYTRKQGPFYLQPSSNNASLLQSRYGQADPSNHSSLQTSSANASLFLSSNDQTDVSKSLSTQPGSITWECGGFATGSCTCKTQPKALHLPFPSRVLLKCS